MMNTLYMLTQNFTIRASFSHVDFPWTGSISSSTDNTDNTHSILVYPQNVDTTCVMV